MGLCAVTYRPCLFILFPSAFALQDTKEIALSLAMAAHILSQGKNDVWTGAFQAESRELFVLETPAAGEAARASGRQLRLAINTTLCSTGCKNARQPQLPQHRRQVTDGWGSQGQQHSSLWPTAGQELFALPLYFGPLGCFGPPSAGLLFAPGLRDCLVVSPTGGTASPQHGSRGEMAPQQPEQHQAAEAAKFLINIIKARALLPVGVLPASIHQGNELHKELLPL